MQGRPAAAILRNPFVIGGRMQIAWQEWSFRERALSLFWAAVACLLAVAVLWEPSSLSPSDVLRGVTFVAIPATFALSPTIFFLPLREVFRITRAPDPAMTWGMLAFTVCTSAALVLRHFGL